jgi:hypothetical protein
MLAGLLSGTKGAFLMFPLFAAALAGFGLIRARLLIAAPLAVGVGALAISVAGLDPLGLAAFGAAQAESYGKGFIVQQVADAIRHGAFGEGIGSSTSAARFGVFDPTLGNRFGFESYFAKAAAELGTIVLVIIVGLLLVIAVHAGLLAIRHYGRESNRIIAPLATYITYVLVTCLKGNSLDVDPANVFFWLSLGVIVGMRQGERARPVVQPDSIAPPEAKEAGA